MPDESEYQLEIDEERDFDFEDDEPMWDGHIGPTSRDEMTPEQVEIMRRKFPACLDLTEGSVPYIEGEIGEWNSFTNSVPDDEGDILVSDGKYVFAVLWCWDGMSTGNPNDIEWFSEITHWMRFPNPPTPPLSSMAISD